MDEKLTKDERKHLRQEEWREKADKEQKKKLYQTVAWWSFGGMLLVLAIWALVVFSQGSSSLSSATLKQPPVTKADFQTNPSGAKATLVEYADFQCPACKAYDPIVRQLLKDYGEKLNLVYRMFPLKTVHQNAINSAKAAYAASLQGKFWEMHNRLFDAQDSWATLPDPESVYVGYTKDLGLDTNTFKKDYEAQATSDFVNNSYDAALNVGVNSTPTFFLNGNQLTNPAGYADFKKLIDQAVK
ncbi:MAG TPA: thioredoxin domain-containing protein [Candidatus Eisenbacteria bacterium]|nr:thioredoxin domain-containing protein [Candidatus Eisenbacteria bacterium]